MVDPELVRKFVEKADLLCDCIRDAPSGCEGCWLGDETTYDEETDEFHCPFSDIKKEIEEQLGE